MLAMYGYMSLPQTAPWFYCLAPSLPPTSAPKLRVAALAAKMSRCKRCNGNSDSWWKVCCHAPAVAVALRTMLKNLKFLAKKNHGRWRKDREITLLKKNALETFSLSVYLCLAFARKYGTLGRSLVRKWGTPLTPMTYKALTTTSKGTHPADYSISSLFRHKDEQDNWVSPKINKPSKISLETLSFLGQPFVFPRNHHLPKRCADHNLQRSPPAFQGYHHFWISSR